MNYYLPCKLCGHNNEASSEYLTFCENCKKKLTINFREWQKGNPEGSVIDFHKNECIPEDDISFPSESELKKKV